MPKPHERFKAWQAGHRFVLEVYRSSAGWPLEERFGLVSQVRRAAISAQLNLVEGAAKRGSVEFARFLDIANGSLAESEYVLRLARDLGYITEPDWRALEGLRDETNRLYWGLYRSMRKHSGRTA